MPYQTRPPPKRFMSSSALCLFLQGAKHTYYFWKSLISKLISVENLWQLGVQPREQGGNRTDREGGEGEEGGKENLLSRKEFLTLPRKRGKAPPLQTSPWAGSHRFLLEGNPSVLPLLLQGIKKRLTFDHFLSQ